MVGFVELDIAAPDLVDGALSDEPQLRRVDAEGALVWADPDAASASSDP